MIAAVVVHRSSNQKPPMLSLFYEGAGVRNQIAAVVANFVEQPDRPQLTQTTVATRGTRSLRWLRISPSNQIDLS